MRDGTDLERYLEVLAGEGHGAGLIEIRYRIPGGMGQKFVAGSMIEQAAGTIRAHAQRSDTFVGVLPRLRRRGRLEDLLREAKVAWVDCDTAASARALAAWRCPPSMVVASGTAEHCHAYWILREPVDLTALEHLNHALALTLGADPGVVTRPHTILRPPGSLNHKDTPPRPVRLLELDSSRSYRIEDLTCGLDDRTPITPSPVRRELDASPAGRVRSRRDHPVYERLREIPAAEYVTRLSGREINREGKALCPLHEERTPSLQTYPDGSWCCFGCGRGGSIVDFAAALWRMDTKGRDFLRVRDRLIDELLRPRRPESGQADTEARPVPRRQTTTTEELTR